MILADVSVRRPIAMGCLIIGLTLLGLNSYRKLGVELMPKIDAPFITITTMYPGASPEEIETDVAHRPARLYRFSAKAVELEQARRRFP